MVSILFDLLSSEKSSTTPYKSGKKNFFKIGHTGYQKKQNFVLISKMCRRLVISKGKKINRKTEFLRTWKILQKIVFLRRNLWELFDARVVRIFEISAKFRFF
jgi:hypothetical protein